jgi:hypothetical protein
MRRKRERDEDERLGTSVRRSVTSRKADPSMKTIEAVEFIKRQVGISGRRTPR